MPDIEKIEFHVIGEDGEAFAWEPDLSTAMSHCKPGNGAVAIDKVIYYSQDREEVWRLPEPDRDDEQNPHPYYAPGDPRRIIPYEDRK